MSEPIEAKEARLFAYEGRRDEIREQIEKLTAERGALPRSDAKGAKALALAIDALIREQKAMKIPMAMARFEVERTERHSLWETAVLTLWGQDGLTACRAQMRQEKRNREAV